MTRLKLHYDAAVAGVSMMPICGETPGIRGLEGTKDWNLVDCRRCLKEQIRIAKLRAAKLKEQA